MPAYFSMTVQRRTDKVTDDYVEQIYSAVIESGFPFKSGYWFHEDAGYDEIVAWNRKKLAQGFQLAIGAAVWNRGLADVIQTNFELDGGYYSIDKVLGGEKLMAHPFAIIPEDVAARFGKDYLSGKRLTRIGNNGVIIDDDAYLSGRRTDKHET